MAKNLGGNLISNRKAYFNYEILETCESGLVLVGTEVKSLRAHHASLDEAYITPEDNALWLVNCTIEPYKFGNIYNHETRRKRKLLLHKREILKLIKKSGEKGLTLLPLRLYFRNGKIKLEVALGKGKKLHDKRDTIKARDASREMARAERDL